MELVMLGISVMLVIVVWHYMLMRTVVDATRDKLFDLRDEIRQTFKEREWDMNSDTYRSLRDLMNGYLRFTEEYSFWRFVYLELSVIADKRLVQAIDEHAKKRFMAVAPEQLDFVRLMRSMAVNVVLEYSVYSSGLLLAMSLVVAPYVLVKKVISVFNQGVGSIGDACWHIVRSFVALFKASATVIHRTFFKPNILESYSYRLGTC